MAVVMGEDIEGLIDGGRLFFECVARGIDHTGGGPDGGREGQ